MSSVLRDAFRIPRGTLSWIRLAMATLRDHFGKPSGLGASFWLLTEDLRFSALRSSTSSTVLLQHSDQIAALRCLPNFSVTFRATRFVSTFGKERYL